MKKISFILLAASLFILGSCKKDSPDSTLAAPVSSSFSIGNLNKEVNEGAALVVNNQSKSGVSYLWDFGNGHTSTDKTPSFAYGMHGDYTIKLTVTDANGKTAVSTGEITVLCIFANRNHPALF